MAAKDNSVAAPPEPWRSFLRELDKPLKGPVELRCLGGFVITDQGAAFREDSRLP